MAAGLSSRLPTPQSGPGSGHTLNPGPRVVDGGTQCVSQVNARTPPSTPTHMLRDLYTTLIHLTLPLSFAHQLLSLEKEPQPLPFLKQSCPDHTLNRLTPMLLSSYPAKATPDCQRPKPGDPSGEVLPLKAGPLWVRRSQPLLSVTSALSDPMGCPLIPGAAPRSPHLHKALLPQGPILLPALVPVNVCLTNPISRLDVCIPGCPQSPRTQHSQAGPHNRACFDAQLKSQYSSKPGLWQGLSFTH